MDNNQSPSKCYTSIFPTKTKCEFCDYYPKCDLDVSRHLNSPEHVKKKDHYKSCLMNQEKAVEEQLPKNLEQVLKSLKLVGNKDLNDLVDKGYFKIEDENLSKIGEQLASVLLKSVVNYETKDLSPSTKEFIKNSIAAMEISNDSREKQKKSDHHRHKNPLPPTQQSQAPIAQRNPMGPDTPRPPRNNRTSSSEQDIKPILVASTSRSSDINRRPIPSQQSRPSNPTTSRPSTSSMGPPSASSTSRVPKQTNQTATTSSVSKIINHKPVPREDSSYIPKLAIIKIEPKD